MIDNVWGAFGLLASWKLLLTICICSLYGLFVGAVPGLTATMAAALLVPFTFFMDPLPALVAIVTMEAMAIFAGDIPAALVRIPGTPSSAAYTDVRYRQSIRRIHRVRRMSYRRVQRRYMRPVPRKSVPLRNRSV